MAEATLVRTAPTKNAPIGRVAYPVTIAARILSMDRGTLLDHLNAGTIRGYRVGNRGQWFIPKAVISGLTGVDPEDLPE